MSSTRANVRRATARIVMCNHLLLGTLYEEEKTLEEESRKALVDESTELLNGAGDEHDTSAAAAVSYTHLTLPTIYSV